MHLAGLGETPQTVLMLRDISEHFSITVFSDPDTLFRELDQRAFNVLFLSLPLENLCPGLRERLTLNGTLLVSLIGEVGAGLHFALKDRQGPGFQNLLFMLYSNSDHRLHLNCGHTKLSVPVREIHFIESCGRKVMIHLLDEELHCYGKLGEIKERLGPHFLMIHKSILVQKRFINRIERDHLLLYNGTELPLSRSGRAALVRLLKRI